MSVAAAVSATTLSGVAQAEMIDRSFCVWDPIGANGPLFNVMKSAKPSAMKWGINLELRAYESNDGAYFRIQPRESISFE